MPWTRTTLPFPGAHCLANRPGPLVRLTFQFGLPAVAGQRRLVGVGRLALPRLFDLESNRSAVPDYHTPVGNPGLAPGRLGDFKSPGSALPAEASRREMVGMKGLAPPRLPESESGPSAVRVKPHAREIGTPGRIELPALAISFPRGNRSLRELQTHPHLRRSKRRALVIELRELEFKAKG